MKIQIKILFNIILLILVVSASAQRDSTKIRRMSDRKLIKKVISQYNNYNNLSFKIDAKIETVKKKHNLNILYRNVKDSLIWINVNHNTGVPVARLLLTQDSTKMLNRLDNEYLLISNEQIVQKFDYDISFEMIQSIFVGKLLNLEPDKGIIQSYKHYKVYIDSCTYVMQNIKKKKINRLVRKDKIDEYYIHQVRIDSDFKILSMSLENNSKKQKIFVEYFDYDKETQIPKKVNIALTNADGETKISMKIRKTKFNKKDLGLSFKIPKKYTPSVLK